jgi:hypothetical protein
MTEQMQRRAVSFQNLDELIQDVQTLHAAGYTSVGNWDLSQACGHLNEWMRYPMDGFPQAPWPMRLLMATLRNTIAPRMMRKVLAESAMKPGNPTIPSTVPAKGGDEANAVDKLCETARRLADHPGPFHASPMFGDLDRESLVKLQLIHCAHHLSFLVPNPSA